MMNNGTKVSFWLPDFLSSRMEFGLMLQYSYLILRFSAQTRLSKGIIAEDSEARRVSSLY